MGIDTSAIGVVDLVVFIVVIVGQNLTIAHRFHGVTQKSLNGLKNAKSGFIWLVAAQNVIEHY